jgi:hypothetical protein
MKIIIDRKYNSERQVPIVTIDTSTCYYPYAIRDALRIALELDGYTEEVINAVFNQYQDAKCEPNNESPLTTLA